MLSRPKKSEAEAEAEARDDAWVVKNSKIPYMNACTPTENLSIPRNHTQYGSHNSVNALAATAVITPQKHKLLV